MQSVQCKKSKQLFCLPAITRQMSDHGPKSMIITPSRFQWDKFKDLLHFFTMLGLIPVTAVVFYANVFVGPAKLTPIPDGYVPKHWEFHRVRKIISCYDVFVDQL